jgi:hypothetical protein
MNISLKSCDVKFIHDILLPFAKVEKVMMMYSDSKNTWPDIWVELGDIPVITVTDEWIKQFRIERQKRLTHEFLHLKGMEHDESIGYSTVPQRDVYSMKIYKELIRRH